MEFKKTFCEIRQPDKSYKFIVHYAKDSTVVLTHVYSNISGGYMGVTIDSFVESMRGLLRAIPNFLEEVDVNPRRELPKVGFEQVEPTELEKMIYGN